MDFINAGLLKTVDVAIMAHPGKVNIARPTFMAMQEFHVEYFGRAAHAAGRL